MLKVTKKPSQAMSFEELLNKVGIDKKKDSATNTQEPENVKSSLTSQRKLPPTSPPQHFSQIDRLGWIQEKRNVGLHVFCDKCDKARYLADVKDPLELPDLWFCYMNPDKTHNDCSVPEVKLSAYEEEFMILNLYNAGSIVWARVKGYPWWPGMVDDCPDREAYYWIDGYTDIPTSYHVVFFDKNMVERAWLKPNAICKFQGNEYNPRFRAAPKFSKFKERIEFARNEAKKALTYELLERLKRFSFITRWSTAIKSPIDRINFESSDYDENRKPKRKIENYNERLKTKLKTKNNIKEKVRLSYKRTQRISPDLFANLTPEML